MIGFSGLSRPNWRRFSRVSRHFEKNWIVLRNLLNAFVFEGKAPPEIPATLLGALLSMSVTSAFVALSVPQCFSTEVEFWKESVLVCWNEVLWKESECEYPQLCSPYSEQQCYLFLAGGLGEFFSCRDCHVGSRSFSSWSHEDIQCNWQKLNSFFIFSGTLEKLPKQDLV